MRLPNRGWLAWQMLTLSAERFQRIQKEAPPELQHYLVQVTKYQAAQNCKVIPDPPLMDKRH